MKTSLKVLLAAVVLGLGMVASSEAANVRGAKAYVAMQGSTTGVVVSSGAAVLYSVVLSTGAAGTDFVVLFDSGAVTGLTAVNYGATYRTRINVSSTTQNTIVVFDPPLQFVNGITALNSNATITSLFTYEKGRVIQGY